MTIETHPQRTTLQTFWPLRHWLHFWQLITQWPLNKEWQGQHSQFLQCFSFWFKERVPDGIFWHLIDTWNIPTQFADFFIQLTLFPIPIWLQTFHTLTSKSNSSSVWICLRVSMVSSSFDNSRTAPNCFRASSALKPPSFFSLMTVTTRFPGSEEF